MTTVVLVIAVIWATFFIFMVRFELQNELQSILTLFQCSKRGFRFLGVLVFHLLLLATISCLVSAVVTRSVQDANLASSGTLMSSQLGHKSRYTIHRQQQMRSIREKQATAPNQDELGNQGQPSREPSPFERQQSGTTVQKQDGGGGDLLTLPDYQIHRFKTNYNSRPKLLRSTATMNRYDRESNTKTIIALSSDKNYLVTGYKIWLTAIVYAFVYLIIENIIMFQSDMTLVEFVHSTFVQLVIKLTGIDLSDYPAGEMPFNALMRRRINS